ncbi:hypothetical protein SAMN02745221_00766 [Thermosyntropha lipolytica DSM 11003]|uniref:Uncharacterized protein n=1 Tax=Thermosyntropha lipolytica DSM 11003 TaxID=1123382 RepID=A0A1M5LW75_9FIRM|nr:hypothetical protein [Thermosyntropha lipolytica]SHG69256.1 hypothetical protein SAMN02745221_00766 [Thermosyntropha lipolytica DSM 11003]
MMMWDREKMENMWAAGMKMSESYWSMWKSMMENMNLWQEKGQEMLNTYMANSKEVWGEQAKWLDAFIMQASKSQQQMQTIMKEAWMVAMENMNNPQYNPWMMWSKFLNSDKQA